MGNFHVEDCTKNFPSCSHLPFSKSPRNNERHLISEEQLDIIRPKERSPKTKRGVPGRTWEEQLNHIYLVCINPARFTQMSCM